MVVAGIEVELVQKNIKNLHLAVYPPDGRVRLAAPQDVNQKTLELYVISKLHWIRKQQKIFLNQNRETERKYVERESHYFLGKRYLLRIHETEGTPEIRVKTKTYLDMYVSKSTSIAKRKELMAKWYRQQLYMIVFELLPKWETILGVKPNRLIVRHMKTKWGSCNTEGGSILLNVELAKKPESCIEYVLAHELAHLIVRKHNARFTALLNKHLPNWKILREELNQLPVSFNNLKS